MAGLLSLEQDMYIELKGIYSDRFSQFICSDVIIYQNQYNYVCSRYILIDLINPDLYILDVQKGYDKNINIVCYKLLEEMEFDLNFYSLIGTSPLGYRHPDMKKGEFMLYQLVKKELSNTDSFKYIVGEDELPQNPKESGYFQDGNSNWYFMADRDKGNLLEFEDDFKRSWEYRREKKERLLIEVDALSNSSQYLKQKPKIYLYSGKALTRQDIKILAPSKVALEV